MQTAVKVRERDGTTVLARKTDVRLSDIGRVISSSFAQVYGYLGAHQVATTEAPFVIYHGMPGPLDTPFEIEICAPISRPIDPPDGWTLTQLPAGTFASIVHVGPYDSVGAAYDELEAWIAEHGYAIHGAPREVYLSEPGTPPADTRTVVEFPVALASGRVPEVAGAPSR
jgi:effector-binding domain-containing protein